MHILYNVEQLTVTLLRYECSVHTSDGFQKSVDIHGLGGWVSFMTVFLLCLTL